MKKRILSAIFALSIVASSAISVAAETLPTVTWGEREILFNATPSRFTDGVFTVPVRRICQLAGAKVSWSEENQRIIIDTKDNMTRIFLYINKDEYRVFKFTSVADGVGTNYKISTPATIVDGRTLVPFEQLCDALGLEYTWSEDKSTVSVKSLYTPEEKRVGMYLEADKEDVSAGDEIVVNVMASNLDLYPGYDCAGYSAGVIFDKNEFEFVSSCLINPDGTKNTGALGADNAYFTDDSAKVVYIMVTPEQNDAPVAAVGQVVLKALTDNGGKISLSNRISSVGYDTTILFSGREDGKTIGLDTEAKLQIVTDAIEVK